MTLLLCRSVAVLKRRRHSALSVSLGRGQSIARGFSSSGRGWTNDSRSDKWPRFFATFMSGLDCVRYRLARSAPCCRPVARVLTVNHTVFLVVTTFPAGENTARVFILRIFGMVGQQARKSALLQRRKFYLRNPAESCFINLKVQLVNDFFVWNV